MATTTRFIAASNDRTGASLGTHVRVADRMASRLRGLLGYPEPQPGQGLLLRPCNGIHMFGMRYPLDVVFLARDGTVIRACESLAPGRAVPWGRRAHEALELPSGTIAATGTQVGDRINIEAV